MPVALAEKKLSPEMRLREVFLASNPKPLTPFANLTSPDGLFKPPQSIPDFRPVYVVLGAESVVTIHTMVGDIHASEIRRTKPRGFAVLVLEEPTVARDFNPERVSSVFETHLRLTGVTRYSPSFSHVDLGEISLVPDSPFDPLFYLSYYHNAGVLGGAYLMARFAGESNHDASQIGALIRKFNSLRGASGAIFDVYTPDQVLATVPSLVAAGLAVTASESTVRITIEGRTLSLAGLTPAEICHAVHVAGVTHYNLEVNQGMQPSRLVLS
ncbi:hypothetical protein HZC07_03545 [Candidatus Micrarchaeota archaeon]|nr:hypothetical protein [Candidatus Micrarchaeota archaeon]